MYGESGNTAEPAQWWVEADPYAFGSPATAHPTPTRPIACPSWCSEPGGLTAVTISLPGRRLRSDPADTSDVPPVLRIMTARCRATATLPSSPSSVSDPSTCDWSIRRSHPGVECHEHPGTRGRRYRPPLSSTGDPYRSARELLGPGLGRIDLPWPASCAARRAPGTACCLRPGALARWPRSIPSGVGP